MNPNTFLLSAEGGCLELTVESTVIRFALDCGEKRVVFGVKTRNLAQKALRDLTEDGPLQDEYLGEIDGSPAHWGCTLCEPFSSMYACDRGSQRLLYGQTFDGAMVGPLILTAVDRARWATQLKFLEHANPLC